MSEWWIFFNDKDCNSKLSLSSQSIQKRLNKKINFDIRDFSICQNYLDSLKKHNIKIRKQRI